MRVLFVLVLMVLVCVSWGQRLARQQQQRTSTCYGDVVALIKKSHCRPVEQPVQVPLPPGYEAVRPLVVMLNRCVGLACNRATMDCLPRQDLVKNISIPVYLYNQDSRRQCSNVEMQIHLGCECGCAKTCPQNQVLDESLCECMCDREEQARCEGRGRLWNSVSCSCHCPPTTTTQCSTGQVFIQQLCRCESY
ncbi:hypothetical protein Pmani_012894 [Petrolisthes manimaculis]|uniref:Platelet-derived growth factor (PDGF) family profile domain-containing protein n=1 Tax=Petrolisthes manimaculis TaxID=1843537 RepID=A0AAE1PZJ7_9EUCA|nr:hypothetical protein Pmani_012894 [Petrolisthes manimaculis]